MEKNTCWICRAILAGNPARKGAHFQVNCDTCGPFLITADFASDSFPLPDTERYRFSYWCKQRQLDGRDPPKLGEDTIAGIVSGLRNPDPSERADILLASLAKLHPKPGGMFKIDAGREYSLACAENLGELNFHVSALHNARLIESVPTAPSVSYIIRPEGWERIAALRETPARSRTAFVAMRFLPDILAMWEPAFVPAIEAAGFTAERSGVPVHNDRIDAEIIVAIKRARFVIADATHANPGVYFEAGYALARGLPVIWTCRNDSQKDMHFDTRQYNHILWSNAEDLKKQLAARIIATI